MMCANEPAALEAYADGELDVEHDAAGIARIADHLVTCAECRAKVANIRQLSASLREHLPYYAASDMLRARIGTLIKQSSSRASAPSAAPSAALPNVATPNVVAAKSHAYNNALRSWRAFALAASVLLAVVTAHDLATSNSARDRHDALNQELIDAHIRSLMSDHLVDVASGDRHTVKPWFEGKVNFAPSVFDFAADSFPLAGGRLDYATGHAMAAIVFHRGQHAINLFVWASDSTDAVIRSTSQDGFNIASWRRNHLQYSAVSTLNRGALAEFAALYVARDSATDAVQR
jgi:anti-sigma factor RsiW